VKRRRFMSSWKEAALAHAQAYWHYKDWRYVSEDSGRSKLAELAMAYYRDRLNGAYRHSIEHPRSKKALDEIRKHGRSLASVALWTLDNSATNCPQKIA
jgi:hypothetical protein